MKDHLLKEKIKEILANLLNPCPEYKKDGIYFSVGEEMIDQALASILALVGQSKLTKKEFHSILCEFPPRIAEDSGQPEWTQGEIDKVWDFITGKCKFIEYRREK